VRRRVLVTGGTGFVGANLVRRLLADGHAVHLLVRPGRATAWRLEGVRDDVVLHRASLDDRAAVERAVRRVKPEWVFHLAAHGAYSWETDLDRILATNVLGTVNLVRACLRTGFAALVNAGSSSEYGFKRRAPGERAWVEPNSHYAVAKVAATHFCRLTAQRERVKIATLRLYSVYGPWEDPGRLMPALIVHGLAGRLPPLVDPRVARDYVYADDVSEAFVRAAAKPHPEPGPVFNVGSGTQTTIRRVVDVARRVLAIAEKPRWGTMPNRQWDTATWVSDSRAIRRALGWKPRYDVERGFRQMVAWMRAEPGRVGWYRAARRGGQVREASRPGRGRRLVSFR
jgi:dolichol-phosphate mannosyltransferase